MVIPHEVQSAMYQHMGEMCQWRFFVLSASNSTTGNANDQIANGEMSQEFAPFHRVSRSGKDNTLVDLSLPRYSKFNL